MAPKPRGAEFERTEEAVAVAAADARRRERKSGVSERDCSRRPSRGVETLPTSSQKKRSE